jgi:hypothetical protein
MEDRPELHANDEWRLIFAMPNVRLRRTFEFGDLAMVRGDDPRVEDIVGSNEAARYLMSGFEYFLGEGSQNRPSAMIFREEHRFSDLWAALVEARNCVAVACACFGWIHSIGQLNNFFYRDTDHFDFFPSWPSTDGNYLDYQGPAMNTRSSNLGGFRGYTHRHLSVNRQRHAECDLPLLNLLAKSWHRIHVTREATRSDRQLMRSLSLAFEACRVPQTMDNPTYDHGKHSAFWVSALETLAAPESGRVKLQHVNNLIALRHLDADELTYEADGTHKTLNADVLKRLYGKLYSLRGEFLHGNPITEAFLVPPFLGSGIRLLDTAPLVYHAALEAYTWRLENLGVCNPWNRLESALVHAHWSQEDELKSRGEW